MQTLGWKQKACVKDSISKYKTDYFYVLRIALCPSPKIKNCPANNYYKTFFKSMLHSNHSFIYKVFFQEVNQEEGHPGGSVG